MGVLGPHRGDSGDLTFPFALNLTGPTPLLFGLVSLKKSSLRSPAPLAFSCRLRMALACWSCV